MRHPTHALIGVLVAALWLAGCSSTKLDETPIESRTPTPISGATLPGSNSGNPAANSMGTAQSNVAMVDLAKSAAVTPPVLPNMAATANAALMQAGRVVYFDYDSFVVKDDFRGVVEAHAKVLMAQRGRHLVIEGHTDERGGREYNLALGQRRAEAVAKQLTLLGVADNQLEAVSFGKERPAVAGVDEASWAKNRRAELKDR